MGGVDKIPSGGGGMYIFWNYVVTLAIKMVYYQLVD